MVHKISQWSFSCCFFLAYLHFLVFCCYCFSLLYHGSILQIYGWFVKMIFLWLFFTAGIFFPLNTFDGNTIWLCPIWSFSDMFSVILLCFFLFVSRNANFILFSISKFPLLLAYLLSLLNNELILLFPVCFASLSDFLLS